MGNIVYRPAIDRYRYCIKSRPIAQKLEQATSPEGEVLPLFLFPRIARKSAVLKKVRIARNAGVSSRGSALRAFLESIPFFCDTREPKDHFILSGQPQDGHCQSLQVLILLGWPDIISKGGISYIKETKTKSPLGVNPPLMGV